MDAKVNGFTPKSLKIAINCSKHPIYHLKIMWLDINQKVPCGENQQGK